MVQEALARREQGHPARRPGEKCRPELVLQRADLSAERRLRDVEALRGAANVPFLGDGHEVTDLREAHGRSMVRAGRYRKRSRQIERVLDMLRSPAALREAV